jgi:hypothetical protein
METLASRTTAGASTPADHVETDASRARPRRLRESRIDHAGDIPADAETTPRARAMGDLRNSPPRSTPTTTLDAPRAHVDPAKLESTTSTQ